MRSRVSKYTAIIVLALVAVAVLSAIYPASAHAAPGQALPIPGWLQDAIDQLQATLVKTLQDTARLGGVMLWGVLKVCGMVGLFGDDFSALFGTVVTEALNAVVTGSVHDLIRGSLMVSLGLFGLSLLARPFWPDLKLVSFQRAALWGIAIQAFLLNAPSLYTTLETWRVDLAEEVAGAISGGSIPGCSGDVVEVLLCVTGSSPANVLDPSLTALPTGIPYGGTESVRDLYNHCVYNPPVLYGDPACDPDNPTGDPWAVLGYAQDALGAQLLALVIAGLILAYGVLQIGLGLAAGMMFVLFPVAAIFAFYLPLESFPAGVIRNYIAIFLKSVVLLALAGIVIRLFSVATGSLAAMAAVALVDLLLCLVMAKEALACLLSSISFVGQSVGSLGAAIGLTGGGGGGGALPSPESRVAASMIGGGAVGQTLMGAPHPYGGVQGTTLLGAGGAALGAPAGAARAALGAAMAAGTGGAGAIVGAVAAARGADYGSLALMGNAASTILGRSAGRGFMTGAGLSATRQALTKGDSSVDPKGAAEAPESPPAPPAPSPLLVPVAPAAAGSAPTTPAPFSSAAASAPATLGSLATRSAASNTPSTAAGRSTVIPANPGTGLPASAEPLQSLLLGDPDTDLSEWSQASAVQIQRAARKLEPASPDVEDAAFGLARAGHRQAQQWQQDDRSPVLAGGSLDPQFVEEVVQREPDAAATLVSEQVAANIPPAQRLSVGEAVALGVTTQRAEPGAPREIPRPPRRPVPQPVQPAPAPEQAEYDPALFEQLRAWRLGAAEQAGQKAFYVFPNATLKRIAAARPQTMDELGAVKGVGPTKLQQYGQAVLDITRQGTQGQEAGAPSAAKEQAQGAKEQEA